MQSFTCARPSSSMEAPVLGLNNLPHVLRPRVYKSFRLIATVVSSRFARAGTHSAIIQIWARCTIHLTHLHEAFLILNRAAWNWFLQGPLHDPRKTFGTTLGSPSQGSRVVSDDLYSTGTSPSDTWFTMLTYASLYHRWKMPRCSSIIFAIYPFTLWWTWHGCMHHMTWVSICFFLMTFQEPW